MKKKICLFFLLLTTSFCFVSCGDKKEGIKDVTESGFYTIPTGSIGDWDEGIYYHDKENETASYYIVSKKDTADNSIIICLSHEANINSEEALLFQFNEDYSIKNVFLAGYTFETHSNENDVILVVYDKDCNVVGNLNVPYKEFDIYNKNTITRSPFFNSNGDIKVDKILNVAQFLNNAREIIGNISDLVDGKFGDVALDYITGRLVGLAELPWYISTLTVMGTKQFIQAHYERFKNHYIGSAEIEITSIKRENNTTIVVSGIIKNAASIPSRRLTIDGYTRNVVVRGVAMGKWGYPGLYINDQCTNLIQVNQNDNKFSYTINQKIIPGQIYYFRPFLAPEENLYTEGDLMPPFDTCIRYGERVQFVDINVYLHNISKKYFKKDGEKYVIEFSINGDIAGNFNELSNWGFDIKTKSGSYTNRYYAKAENAFSPPTSKEFSCEVELTAQDIEKSDTDSIASIIVTPFVTYWNRLPPMDFLEAQTFTINLNNNSCPDENHPHWIDLGLPSGTMWACCNEGAEKPEDYGNYYTWGGISSAPTLTQINELLFKCTIVFKPMNDALGWEITGSNGGKIFLPAAGYYGHNKSGGWTSSKVGSYGYYWSSTPIGEDIYFLYIKPSTVSVDDGGYKLDKYSLRKVCKKENLEITKK